MRILVYILLVADLSCSGYMTVLLYIIGQMVGKFRVRIRATFAVESGWTPDDT